MKLLFAILVLIALVALFIKLRSHPNYEQRATKGTAPVREGDEGFHAVSILPGKGACKQAKAMQGQRFLSGDALRIPLAKCDAAECSCRYVHYEDRRTSIDRRDEWPAVVRRNPGAGQKEQRSGKDRRQEQAERRM